MTMKNIDKEDFDIYKALLPYCKKILPTSLDQPREIDFIALQKDLESFHDNQRKVCEEIVDVVDLHLEEFYEIATKMQSVQDKLSKADELYSTVTSNVSALRGNILEQESKLKVSLETYELKQLEASLLEQSRQAFSFLLLFNERFELIKQKDFGHLSKRDKNLLIKFSYKLGYMRKIISHHLIKKYLRGEEEIETLQSLELQFQTYISEQLIRMAQQKDYKMEECSVRMCYQYLNKQDIYFGIIQEHLVWNELRVVEAELLSNKTSIIASKDSILLQNFFKNLFLLISQLPKGFPKKRTIGFLKDFLNKKQFNFLYTYTLPVFPRAFKAFFENIHFLNDISMEKEIMKSHKWNIKMWADVKSQDILRKSQGQDLIQWLQTVFHKDNILEGIQAKVVKTALLIIGRYCYQIKSTKCSQIQYSQTLSNLITYQTQVPTILKSHLTQLKIQSTIIDQIIYQIITKLQQCVNQFLSINIQMIVTSTVCSLHNTSSFLNKVLNSNQTQIHPPSIIFKSLNSHLRTYPDLSTAAQSAIKKYIIKQLQHKYQKLKQQVLQYSAANMTTQQKSLITKALQKDRIKLLQYQ